MRPPLMDDLHYRLNFDLSKKSKILKGILEIRKTAKFGCEML